MTEQEKVRVFNDGYHAGQKSVVDFEVKIELRDRFVMAALTGLISDNKNMIAMQLRAEKEGLGVEKEIAINAYALASAMLAERDK